MSQLNRDEAGEAGSYESMKPTSKRSHSVSHSEQKAKAERRKTLIETDKIDKLSKRSVERHYYARDTQLCRNFVSKPQRRSPLLNRFYWLRTKAVDYAVNSFLQNYGKDPKMVVNLGSGSDVLPWRHNNINESESQDLGNVHWVDVDFPEVLKEKATIVARDAELKTLLGEPSYTVDEPEQCFIEGTNYSLIGCDFVENAAFLKERLSQCATSNGLQRRVLLVAEMSLSLNDSAAVDGLLAWFRSILNANICILDLKPSPILHLVAADYPRPDAKSSLADQKARFSRLVSADAHVSELWEVWSDDEMTAADERQRIHELEPFDDWEDFIVWTRHFALIQDCCLVKTKPEVIPEYDLDDREIRISSQICEKARLPSLRFGSTLPVRSPEGRLAMVQMFGTANNKLNTCYNVFAFDHDGGQDDVDMIDFKSWGPPPRTHSTLTDLGTFGHLLVGGSAGFKMFSDSWFFRGGLSQGWDVPTSVMKLPFSVSRHSAVRLGRSGMALILGGLRPQGSSQDPILFHPTKGWKMCKVQGAFFGAVFGALAWCESEIDAGTFCGYLCGGLKLPGLLSTNGYKWIINTTTSQPTITFSRCPEIDPRLISFGARVHKIMGQKLICGGVGQHLLGNKALLLETPKANDSQIRALRAMNWPSDFLGASITSTEDHEIVLTGGGVNCFPTQRFESPPPIVCSLVPANQVIPTGRRLKLLKSLNISKDIPPIQGTPSGSAFESLSIVQIPRVKITSSTEFEVILKERKPVVIEKLDFGSCLRDWTAEYMTEKVGADTQVVVHEGISDSPRMDFNFKNFKYVTDAFGKIVSRMQAGGRLYLRALSRSKPSEIPANLDDDFPALAPDFVLPAELANVKENLFSSILRLSGKANMWLHYDVMANIYTQVGGSKRMVLFPPASVTKLGFSPGASSSSLDVFDTLRNSLSSLAGTKPHEANLGPGDALFLPAAWLHTAEPLTDMSVAVNVFFRDLTSGYAEGRDVYGNRDLGGYEKGRQDLKKVLKGFKDVPDDLKEFYLKRLAQELEQMATSDS